MSFSADPHLRLLGTTAPLVDGAIAVKYRDNVSDIKEELFQDQVFRFRRNHDAEPWLWAQHPVVPRSTLPLERQMNFVAAHTGLIGAAPLNVLPPTPTAVHRDIVETPVESKKASGGQSLAPKKNACLSAANAG